MSMMKKEGEKSGVRLSQCMIVKNEEANIECALSWARDIAFEQIVVDTGSTDNTVEIAERLGARVYHFEWIDDFAAAKNYAIEKAGGDWIALLDADEYLPKEDAAELMLLLNDIDNRPDGHRFEVILNSWIQLNEKNKPFAIYKQQRVFRNKPEIRYSGRIHEDLIYSKERYTALNISIMHTGYTVNTSYNKKKRNKSILVKLIEEYPENMEYVIYLADSMKGSKDEEELMEAELLFKTALRSDYPIYHEMKVMAYDYLISRLFLDNSRSDEALVMCEEALCSFPENIDYLYYYGSIQNKKGNHKAAWDSLTKSESIIISGKEVQTANAENHKIRLYYELALAAQGLNDTHNYVRCMTMLIGENKKLKGVLMPYIHTLKQNGVSTDDIITLLKKQYDFTDISDKLFIVRAAKDAGEIELAQKVLDLVTEEEREWLSGGRSGE